MRTTHAGWLLLLLIILFGCQKDDFKSTPEEPAPTPLTAQIVLPEGSLLLSKQLTVTNGLFESIVSENEFLIDTSSIHNTFSFVTDELHQVYLVKYNAPNSTDHQITPHSTAIALLMASPMMMSLTYEGKANFESYISGTTEFTALENEIKDNLLQGKPVTDSNNTSLRDAILAVFDKMAANGTTDDPADPIIIERDGPQVNLTNNGAANTYVAGVYKDGQRINSFTLIRGTPRFAASPVQVLTGIYSPFTNPDRQTISLEGNGDYEIRIRSGNPTVTDGSEENFMATRINLIEMAWSIAETLLPSNVACLDEIRNGIENDYTMEIPTMTGTMQEISTSVYTLAQKIIAGNITRAKVCYNDESIFNKYAEVVKLFTGYLGTLPEEPGTPMNVTPRLYHLYNNQQQFDFCYTVNGNDIADCNAPSTDTFTYSAYHEVPGTTIGATIEFRLSFTGKFINGTATSIAFDYGSGIQTVPVTGTLEGNTMQLLIHADNNITPALVDCIPQPAPQCESCSYTGDRVIQDWEINGSVNDDHSAFNGVYTRKFIYTSLIVGEDCTTTTVIEEAEEIGTIAY